jgi:hypothetical protein
VPHINRLSLPGGSVAAGRLSLGGPGPAGPSGSAALTARNRLSLGVPSSGAASLLLNNGPSRQQHYTGSNSMSAGGGVLPTPRGSGAGGLMYAGEGVGRSIPCDGGGLYVRSCTGGTFFQVSIPCCLRFEPMTAGGGAASGASLADVRQEVRHLRLQELQWRVVNARMEKSLQARKEQVGVSEGS